MSSVWFFANLLPEDMEMDILLSSSIPDLEKSHLPCHSLSSGPGVYIYVD